MRASLACLLAACALFGIPRLAGELREYRRESWQPAPIVASVPPENQPAAHIAPVPKVADAAPPAKQAPVQLVSLQHESSPHASSPAIAGTAPPSPAKETDLIPEIQKELTRLGFYDGPITDKWNRPVRGAVREFFRSTGSRVRSPQPTAELLTMLHAADVKRQEANPREGTHSGKEHAAANEAPLKETAPKQNAAVPPPAAPVPAAPDEDYLPPWMTASSEAARSDPPLDAGSRELAEAPPSAGEVSKRHFHRRHRAERSWKGRHHYVSRRGYYARRRAFSFPF